MDEKVYLNKRLVSADRARVSVFDAGIQHGVGLFETMRAYSGSVFRLSDHIDRLKDSARDLSLVLDRDVTDFRKAIDRLLEANGLTDARVRLTVTGGSVRLGVHKGQAQGPPTVLITAAATKTYPQQYYQNGMTVLITDYRVSGHDPIARHKTVSYLPRLMALRKAQQAGVGEAIWFTTDGHLAEGSISNIFMATAGKLQTPGLQLPILPGVTRKVVLEIAQREGIEVQEGQFTIKQLLAAEEVFVTNSIMEVMPVTHIERHVVGTGQVGKLTSRIMQRYREMTNQ